MNIKTNTYVQKESLDDIMNDEWGRTMWGARPVENREYMLHKIASPAAREFLFQHVGAEEMDKFIYNDPVVVIEPMPEYAYGAHGDGEISINSRNAARMEDVAFSTTVHESVHSAQHAFMHWRLAHGQKDLDRDTQLIVSGLDDSLEKHNTFGINTRGRVYIQPSDGKAPSQRSDLRDALYESMVIERQAVEMEINISKRYGFDVDRIGSNRAEHLGLIRSTYYCESMSDAELYELIDNAQLNIAYNRTPSNAIEASITYDMATMLYEQQEVAGPIRKMLKDRALDKMLNPEEKAKSLAAAGYRNANTMSMQEIEECDLQKIKALPSVVRDQNPILMSLGMLKYGEEVVNLVDREVYDEWYFSDGNVMSCEQMDQMADVMGPEYGASARLERMGIGDIDLDSIDLVDMGAEPTIDLFSLGGSLNDILDSQELTIEECDKMDIQDREP